MIRITDEMLEKVFNMAMRDGLTCWCSSIDGTFDDMMGDNPVTLVCTDNSEEYELTKEKLKRGIMQYQEQTGDFDLELDGDAADDIIQLAIFGELLY